MAFGQFSSGSTEPMVDINTTPLVDVMLVLLVIFLVTAPLITPSIPLDLPRVQSESSKPPPETIRLALDAGGTLYWNDTPYSDTTPQNSLGGLEMRLREAAHKDSSIEVQLSADRDTRYERVAEIMATAKRAGITRLGFLTDPSTGH